MLQKLLMLSNFLFLIKLIRVLKKYNVLILINRNIRFKFLFIFFTNLISIGVSYDRKHKNSQNIYQNHCKPWFWQGFGSKTLPRFAVLFVYRFGYLDFSIILLSRLYGVPRNRVLGICCLELLYQKFGAQNFWPDRLWSQTRHKKSVGAKFLDTTSLM